jgi:thiosulfate dehydrogenase
MEGSRPVPELLRSPGWDLQREESVKKFLFGVFVGLVAIAGGGFAYFAGGFAPVATSAPPMPFERMLAGRALHARIEKEMPRTVPIEASETTELAGARLYVQHCAVCHGLPDQPEGAIARGEFPRPPQLFRGHGVTDDPPGETWWKVTNGIRLTGMPGFGQSLSEPEVWQVSLLLANADKLSPAVKAALAEGPCPEAPESAVPGATPPSPTTPATPATTTAAPTTP